MTHQGLTHVIQQDQPHLGGNMDHGDPWSHAPQVWTWLIDRFGIQSIMDIGSGRGHAARWFHRQGIAAIAVDGLAHNARSAVHPTVICDVSQGHIQCPVDLVISVEMVEHVRAEHMGNLMACLTNAPVVMITHAVPGQGGYHHVNEQPQEYWEQRFAERGYTLSADDTHVVRRLARLDDARHLANHACVFVRPGIWG